MTRWKCVRDNGWQGGAWTHTVTVNSQFPTATNESGNAVPVAGSEFPFSIWQTVFGLRVCVCVSKRDAVMSCIVVWEYVYVHAGVWEEETVMSCIVSVCCYQTCHYRDTGHLHWRHWPDFPSIFRISVLLSVSAHLLHLCFPLVDCFPPLYVFCLHDIFSGNLEIPL